MCNESLARCIRQDRGDLSLSSELDNDNWGRNMQKKWLATSVSTLTLAVIGCIADGHLACAAETSTASEAVTPTALGEVVVVARRREENLQNVPAAVTAVGAEELQAKSIQTTRELAIATPSLNVGGNFTSSFMSFSMRGNIPNANTSGFTDATV